MNNLLDFNRLGLLIKKQWIEQRKTYLISAGALVAILGIMFFFTLFFSRNVTLEGQTFQMFLFIISFMISGTINTSRMLKSLSERTESISFLLLPASHLEKFLCSMFYSIFVYGIVFLMAFYLVDFVAVTIYNFQNHANVSLINFLGGPSSSGKVFLKGLSLALLIHAFGLWGSVFFKNRTFIKTMFLGFVAAVVFGLISQGLGFAVFGQSATIDAFRSVTLGGTDIREPLKIELPSGLGEILQYFVWTVVTIGLWVAGYFGLKEREIV
ncbi:hypothetical protein SAMN04515674_102100 [Pseudarcicella hirudinis]|uniref:ABC-2 family transporter protein n=1 Tax=Pseudarcicella hirudinis TaxID=1079859 RepID=A0A1I5NSR0_9BACT|nr:hypothetical protein [Pseudarcicella hirudinis]SFP24813.1 hypothetical protein SAMN04515674_102100 [Pseudarcicella hirudinis]